MRCTLSRKIHTGRDKKTKNGLLSRAGFRDVICVSDRDEIPYQTSRPRLKNNTDVSALTLLTRGGIKMTLLLKKTKTKEDRNKL